MKVAIITPYHKEPLWKLKRCHKSVIGQSHVCTHFLVADGHPRKKLKGWACRHIILPLEHGDNGNTPRAIGSVCAMNEGFNAILFLDADNWYERDHVSSMIQTQLDNRSDAVFSYRHIVFPDGETIAVDDPEDLNKSHVDTSCMAIFSSAFKVLPGWFQMPREFGPWCDRVIFRLLFDEFRCSWTEKKSVFFETQYRGHYELAGRVAPNDAKVWPETSPEHIRRANLLFSTRSYRPCILTPQCTIVSCETEARHA